MLFVGDQLPVGSIYRLLAQHGGALFGEEYFADLFKRSTLGRPTVPARVVATVMLLQAYEVAMSTWTGPAVTAVVGTMWGFGSGDCPALVVSPRRLLWGRGRLR